MSGWAPTLAVELAAQACGQLHWLSGRVFEISGRWAGQVGDDRAAVALTRCSRHLGEHSRWWAELQPESVLVDPASARGPGHAAVGELVADLDALDDDLERLVALGRFALPQLAADVAELVDRCRGPAAGATARVGRWVLADLAVDQADVWRVAGALMGDRGHAERAGELLGRLSGRLVACGGRVVPALSGSDHPPDSG